MKIPSEIIGYARSISTAYKLNFVGVLTHWAIESRWGQSKLTNSTNNSFNLKCFNDCSSKYKVVGSKKAYDKTEKSNDAYRVYSNMADGFDAYGYYLRVERKKTDVFFNDSLGYFKWLKAIGFMTDKSFVATASNVANSVVKDLQDANINISDNFTSSGFETVPKNWGVAHPGTIPPEDNTNSNNDLSNFINSNFIPIAVILGIGLIVLLISEKN